MKHFIFIALLGLLFSCTKNQDLDVTVTVNEIDASSSEMTFNVSADSKGGSVSQIGIMYRFAPNIDLDEDYLDDNGNYSTYQETNSQYEINIQTLKTNASNETISIENFVPGVTYYAVGYAVINGKVYYSSEFSFGSPELDNVATGPAGGVVIYEDGNGGGIEITPFFLNYKTMEYDYIEYNSYINWGCQNTTIVGTQESVGSGQMNTDTILVQCNEINIAADICTSLSYGGYDDWYLPSLDELLLAPNKMNALGINVNQSSGYWSSSNDSNGQPYYVNLYDGNVYSNYGGTRYVIAARSF